MAAPRGGARVTAAAAALAVLAALAACRVAADEAVFTVPVGANLHLDRVLTHPSFIPEGDAKAAAETAVARRRHPLAGMAVPLEDGEEEEEGDESSAVWGAMSRDAMTAQGGSRARQLATTCTPSTSNGVWTGQPPDLSACGNFYWTGAYGNAMSISNTIGWSLTCNSGYALYGSSGGTCYGYKSCQYDPNLGYGSCSSVCSYTCSGCGWSSCIYCCVCSNSFGFSYGGGSCIQCVPPTASNAVNPSTTAGTETYTWTCKPGYWAAAVSRTCGTYTDGSGNPTWSGSAISCTACTAPSTPTNGYISKTAADTWLVGCNGGYYSSTTPSEQTRVCSRTDGSMSGSQPTCTACGAGYYCTGGLRQLCPAGTYGSSSATTLSSSTCSGTCLAGYFCGAGSTSSTANACGSIDTYCPAGSGAPVTVSAGYYTTPTSAASNLRTGQAACPANRACSGGVVLAGLDLATPCPLNKMSTTLDEMVANSDFGPTLAVNTPGYSGTVTWTVTSVTAVDTTCVLTTGNFSVSAYTGYGRLRVNWPLDYPSCPNGFTLAFKAARSNDATLYDTCTATITVNQIAKMPVLTDCKNRAVPERSLAGANVGTPFAATNLNVGTSLLWFVNYTTAGNVPFSVGMCDGQLRVLRPFLWKDTKAYKVDLSVRNDGSSIGIGSRTAYCTMWVNVTQVPIPPTPTVTAFQLPELSAVGTLLGNVGGVDANNFTFNCSWGAVDSPNAFAVSRGCNITVALVQDTLVSLKSTFSYMLNMTNGFATSSTPVTITLLPVARPPSTSDQSRTIRDDATVGTVMGTALSATHPQKLNLTFSLATVGPFNVTPGGVPYLCTAGVLNYQTQSVYTVVFIVTDTNGQQASANLVITLIESNKKPSFTAASYAFTVAEGSVVGASVAGTPAVAATDPNTRDALTFRFLTYTPSAGRTTFAMDPTSGAITLGAGLASTGGVLRYDTTLVYPVARTFTMNISVTDNGAPIMSANASVSITIVSIAPRVVFTTAAPNAYTIPGNVTIGASVANASAFTWTPYARSGLSYAVSAEPTIEGDTTFDINAVTGIITVANATYYDPAAGRFVWGRPRFDYNTRNVFNVNVTITDAATSLRAVANLQVFLSHINRPPTWGSVPRLYAAALTSANIGQPLSSYVSDPDTAVPTVAEVLRYSIVSGNIDTTFGIDIASGQIYVANNRTPSFDLTNVASVGTYNLTIRVTDAGIDGPVYNATTVVSISVTASNFPPSIGFFNLTVDELVPVGTVVGNVTGTDVEAVSRLTYAIAPAGPNINQPFPFNVSTLPGGISNYGRGLVYVIDDGPIDWNQRFKVYYATITVTDNDPATPLSGTGSLQINVRWVPRPPFFDPSKVPGIRVFSLSVNEHALPGALVTTAGTGVLASSKDPWQRPLLRYSWRNAGSLASLFAIDAVGANVTMAPGAPNLDFNNRSSYTLTVMAVDTNNLNDTATVIINIVDINDPAVFNGIGDATNTTVPPGKALRVAENATVGTVFGYVRAYDVDRDVRWGQMNFGLVATADARFFGINSATGALSVASVGLDYWDQTLFVLNVSVTDGDFFNPISVYTTVVVNITQVNTVAVTRFAMPAGTPAAAGVNVSTSAYAATYAGIDVLLPTAGVPSLLLIGRGFGRTARRLAAEGATAAATHVVASYGRLGTEFVVAGCAVVVPNTVISCPVPAGIGAGHVWTVAVDGWSIVTTAKTGFLPPVITAVYRTGTTPGNATQQTLSTRGGQSITLEGTNCGAVGTQVQLTYASTTYAGTTYTTVDCNVAAPGHAVVVCTSTAGVGGSLGYTIALGAQTSPLFTATALRYETPVITHVTAPLLATEGGERNVIVVNGTGFGPASLTSTTVYYSMYGNFSVSYYPVFTATSCFVPAAAPHSSIICTSAAGIGSALRVLVVVAGQSSVVSSPTQVMAYRVPVITGISGLGASGASTEGGQDIMITGTDFGPVTPLYPSGDPMPGALQPLAWYGPAGNLRYAAANCRVASANRLIVCYTVPGTGKDHVWQVSVGEQHADVFLNRTTNYHPPIVASYSGAGAANAMTQGAQLVRISGTDFGPAGTSIDRATYGSDVNGSTFTAFNCSLVVPHTTIDCLTVVGAGAGLSWYVVVDGQRSVSPSTNYGRPEVYNFTGAGAMDANTDGGDEVVINGNFFSVDAFLQSVTYGPSGTEFVAAGCHLSVNHSAVTCTTVPGVGPQLKWLVTVGGQMNVMAEATTSYAPPRITATSSLRDTTAGGAIVTLTGTNFGINYPAARVVVKFDNLAVAGTPSEADIAAHWDSMAAGSGGLPAVTSWISALTTLRPSSVSTLSRGVHRLQINIPEGFGANCTMFVSVNDVPSNIVRFSYDPPRITNAAPDRQDVPVGFLRVFLDGTSFCNGMGDCGTVTAGNRSITVRQWTHTLVLFVIQDLAATEPDALAVITVGGQVSNAFRFRKPVPNLSNLVTQPTWAGMDTRGGELFYILGVLDIGVEPITVTIGGSECENNTRAVTNGKGMTDPDAMFTVTCITPPGVGMARPVVITSLGGSSSAAGGSVVQFSYAAPTLSDMVLGGVPSRRLAVPAGVPTLGSVITLSGNYFGTPALLAASNLPAAVLSLDNQAQVPILGNWTQDTIWATLPPGDGAVHFLVLTMGNLQSPPFSFAYARPSVTGVVPAHGPTVGGTHTTVYGYNFGITLPAVTIGGRPCAVQLPFTPAADHGSINCTVPPGQDVSQAVAVTVTGQVSSAMDGVAFDYDPPVVASIVPTHGPTSGRYFGAQIDAITWALGDRIVQVIRGVNFGSSGTILLQPDLDSDPLSVNITVPAADELSWNDTTLVFYAPEGFGSGLKVRVIVGQQYSAADTSVMFDYDPPEVYGATRYDRALTDCTPRQQCYYFGNTTQCKWAVAQCYDTRGNYPLRVVGNNFGVQTSLSRYTEVSVGGRRCARDDRYPQSHIQLVCTVPQGLGDTLPVVVAVGVRVSAVTNASRFSYDPPVITSIMPNTPDAAGKQQVAFRGKNMGFEVTPLTVEVGGLPCGGAEWMSDSEVHCTPDADVVGPKNISILVANRSEPIVFLEYERMLITECKYGFWGLRTEVCLACMRGGVCPGGEQEVDLVTSDAGFWRNNLTVPDTRCARERQGRVEWGCPFVTACEPSWSCLGNNTCEVGYEGDRCMFCLKGKYYRVNGECIKCPDSIAAVLIGMALLMIVAFGFAYWLNKRRISIALLSIGVDYAQVLSMFAKTRIQWPPAIKQVFQILSAFNLNLDLTAPECLMPTLKYYQQWGFIELLPFSFVVLFAIIHTAKVAYKAVCFRASKRELYSHTPTLISTCIVIFRVLYLYLTRTSMDVMNCAPTDPPDGHQYMSGHLDIPCWESDSVQVKMFPFALLALGIYTVGIPAYMFLYLRRNRYAVKTDQLLRAKDMGDDRLTNPKYYEFRKSLSKLYYHFTPGHWYWEFIIFGRKAFLAFTSLMFRSTPSYQLALALLLLFVAYVLHVRSLPYLTHANRARVVEEHHLKVLTDPMHASIEADFRATEKLNTRKRQKAAALDLKSRKLNTAQATVLAFFDYNTVESIMLASSILTVLAGIMFDSNRFTGDNLKYYKKEYDSLTIATLMLLVATISYFTIVVLMDLSYILCPQRAATAFAMCSTKSAPPPRRAAKHAAGAGGEEGGNTSELYVNPLMMAAATSGGNADGSGDSVVDAGSIASLVGLPSPALWKAIQASYGRLTVMVEELRRQVKDAKKEAGAAEVDGGSRGPTPRAAGAGSRMRRQFVPVAAAGEGAGSGGGGGGGAGGDADAAAAVSAALLADAPAKAAPAPAGGVPGTRSMVKTAGSSRSMAGGGGGGDDDGRPAPMKRVQNSMRMYANNSAAKPSARLADLKRGSSAVSSGGPAAGSSRGLVVVSSPLVDGEAAGARGVTSPLPDSDIAPSPVTGSLPGAAADAPAVAQELELATMAAVVRSDEPMAPVPVVVATAGGAAGEEGGAAV